MLVVSTALWYAPPLIHTTVVSITLSFHSNDPVETVCAACGGCSTYATRTDGGSSASSPDASTLPILLIALSGGVGDVSSGNVSATGGDPSSSSGRSANLTVPYLLPGDGSYRIDLQVAGTLIRSVDATVDTDGGVTMRGAASQRALDVRYEPAAASEASLAGCDRRVVTVRLWFSHPVVEFGPSAVTPAPANCCTLAAIVAERNGSYFELLYLADENLNATFTVAGGGVQDARGFPGLNDVSQMVWTGNSTSGGVFSRMADIGGSVLSGVAFGAAVTDMVMTTAAAFAQVVCARFAFLEAGFHLQLLAMSAQLAVPELSADYRNLAHKLRWTVLAIKGNAPSFDGRFTDSQQTVSAASLVALQLPSSSNDTAAEAMAEQTINSGGRRSTLQTGGTSNTTDLTSGMTGGTFVMYASDVEILIDTQDLLYTLAVAGIVFGAVLLIHAIFVLLYRRLVCLDLPPFLLLPRLEMTAAALLIVALTFYACLELGGRSGSIGGGSAGGWWNEVRIAAVLVMVLLTGAFCVLLWWLSLARVWMYLQSRAPVPNGVAVGAVAAARDTAVTLSAAGAPADAVLEFSPADAAYSSEWPTLERTPGRVFCRAGAAAGASSTLQRGRRRAAAPSQRGLQPATPVAAAGAAGTATSAASAAPAAAAAAAAAAATGSGQHLARVSGRSPHRDPSPRARRSSTNAAQTGRPGRLGLPRDAPDAPLVSSGQSALPLSPAQLSRAGSENHHHHIALPDDSHGDDVVELSDSESAASAGAGKAGGVGARNRRAGGLSAWDQRADGADESETSDSESWRSRSAREFDNDSARRSAPDVSNGHSTQRRQAVSKSDVATYVPPESALRAVRAIRAAHRRLLEERLPPLLPSPRDGASSTSTSRTLRHSTSGGTSLGGGGTPPRGPSRGSAARPSMSLDGGAPAPTIVAYSRSLGAQSPNGSLKRNNNSSGWLGMRPTTGRALAEGHEEGGSSSVSGDGSAAAFGAWSPPKEPVAAAAADGFAVHAHSMAATSSRDSVTAEDAGSEGGSSSGGSGGSAGRLERWLMPRPATMARFEFLFEDVVGAVPVLRPARVTSLALLAAAASFTHKAAMAAVFGLWGLQLRSWAQLICLVVLQGVMMMYLLVAWPYVEWQLQWVQLLCHALEMLIYLSAMVLMARGGQVVSWVMIVLFFMVLTLVLAYELRRLYLLCALLVEHVSARRALRRQSGGKLSPGEDLPPVALDTAGGAVLQESAAVQKDSRLQSQRQGNIDGWSNDLSSSSPTAGGERRDVVCIVTSVSGGLDDQRGDRPAGRDQAAALWGAPPHSGKAYASTPPSPPPLANLPSLTPVRIAGGTSRSGRLAGDTVETDGRGQLAAPGGYEPRSSPAELLRVGSPVAAFARLRVVSTLPGEARGDRRDTGMAEDGGTAAAT